MRKRLYSLFAKVGRRWVRVTDAAMRKDRAVLAWQSFLIYGYQGRRVELRPITEPMPA